MILPLLLMSFAFRSPGLTIEHVSRIRLSDDLEAVHLAPNGSCLIAEMADGHQIAYRLPRARRAWQMKADSFSFFPDSKTLAIGVGPRVVQVDALTGRTRRVLVTAPGPHYAVAISKDSRTLYAMFGKSSVGAWSLNRRSKMWSAAYARLQRSEGNDQGDELIPLSDGRCALLDSFSWNGEPGGAGWWLGIFDRGKITAQRESQGQISTLDGLAELKPGRLVAFEDNPDTDKGPRIFEESTLVAMTTNGMPPGADRLFRARPWLFFFDDTGFLQAWSPKDGSLRTAHIKRPFNTFPGSGERWPASLEFVEISADGHTMVMDDGRYLDVIRIEW